MNGIPVPVRQGSPEWLAYRRTVITGTALPAILGISPWRCEADLADEMRGIGDAQESTIRMRKGSALEPFVLGELAAGHAHRPDGSSVPPMRTQRFRAMVRHPEIEWAAASPDARVVGERRLVEIKTSGSRTRFADGIPQDVAAQVAWQLGCTGYPVADVAILTDDALTIIEQEADPALFADLVAVAVDFRRRLAAGGPFARDASRIKRDHPADDGSEVEADGDTAEAVRALLDVRGSRKRLEDDEERLESAIKARMADAAVMTGQGFRVTWKRTKDREETDWKAVAASLIAPLPETERAALVGPHVTVRAGFRPFRVTLDKETE